MMSNKFGGLPVALRSFLGIGIDSIFSGLKG